MKRLSRNLLAVAALVGAPALAGDGFTLLGFSSEENVNAGNYRRWVALSCGSGPAFDVGEPVTLTYKVADDFLDNQDPQTVANAEAAIVAALQTWTDGTRNFVRFSESPWIPVKNSDSTPRSCWEGPGIDEWLTLPPGSRPAPGWGGNIEFFSVPTGWQITSNGIDYEMGAGNLAFAAVTWTGNEIRSVDIYVNEDFDWTTNPAGAANAPVQPQPYRCSSACTHGPGEHTLPGSEQSGADAAGASRGVVYDLQTVMTHEIGHALGLDHPNEAGQFNGALINPLLFNFLPSNCWQNTAVMHGAYTGVKRQLADPEYGGMAFLYPPDLDGDLDSDGVISLLDSLGALELSEPGSDPTPWEVNLLDFVKRDALIGVEEVTQVLAWATNPDEYPPGEFISVAGACDGTGSKITIEGTLDPSDVGRSNKATLTITIDNPQGMPVQAWDFDIQYDTAIFSNPVLSDGDYLPGGLWVGIGPDDGVINFSKLSTIEDCAESGVLGVVEFDTNLAAAAAAGSVSLTFPMQQLIVTCPSLHEYGTLINESYIVTPASAIAWNYDANSDGNVTLEDWYAFIQNPIDVDGDGMINSDDQRFFRDGLRFDEVPSMTSNR